jgi:hypothetical protein
MSGDSGYLMMFAPLEKEDTIVIYVKYLPSVNRQAMNMGIEGARVMLSALSKARGWSSWLKVREVIEMAEPK